MSEILLNISRYSMIFIILFYVYISFRICGKTITKDSSISEVRGIRIRCYIQNIFTGIIFAVCSAIVMYNTKSLSNFVIILLEIIYAITTVALYRVLYPECSNLILNNMMMLLSIGFIMAFRLAPNNALKQFIIVVVATIISFFVPWIIKHKKFWMKSRYILAIVGIILLGLTLVLGKTSFGANLSINLGFIAVQPSEFVKLMYVLFVAGVLSKADDFKNVIISAVLAAVHVLILIVSNDLGAGLILFVVYIAMLFTATGKFRYLLAGFGAGGIAAVAAYNFIGHVKTRVVAWLDPWSVIDGGGYQITQSLFAIASGGLFGLGLYEGLPTKIPVVAKDFVFSAIAEEFGLIFAISIILICFSSFIGIMRTAIRVKDLYYKLIAVGFGVLYIFQCFLTIGGVTKFIPSTGVTLPFISYGGSSILSSIIMFSIIQAVFILDAKTSDRQGAVQNEER